MKWHDFVKLFIERPS